MSILIKGMEMPKRHLIGDGQIVVKDLEKNKLFEGKIEEVRTPHGRLIDADTINYPLGWQGEIVKAVIGEAPTIIEAEVSE